MMLQHLPRDTTISPPPRRCRVSCHPVRPPPPPLTRLQGCDELLKRLKPEQPRKLRCAELHVVHAHVAAHQLFALRLVRELRQLLERRPELRPVFSAVMQQVYRRV